MNTNDRTNVQTKSLSVRSSSRPRPSTRVSKPGGMPISSAACLQRLDPVGQGVAGRDVGPHGHHPLPVEPVDAGRRLRRSSNATTLSIRVSTGAGGVAAVGVDAAAAAGCGLART